MAEYVRVLTVAQSVLSRVSRGKGARMKAAARRKAVNSVQRAWRKASQRWNLHGEIEARVKVGSLYHTTEIPRVPPTHCCSPSPSFPHPWKTLLSAPPIANAFWVDFFLSIIPYPYTIAIAR